jgi:RNA polymerase sigma-70 factor (ECF subfamily)
MKAVHAAAFRLSGDLDAAKDLTQETYLRAYRTFDNFEPGTNCRAWLLKIVYTVFVNRYHKSRREPQQVPLDERFHQTAALGTEADHVEMASARGGLAGASPDVDGALGALPEAFRSAIVLVDIEGLSYEEAASVLGVPLGTVRSRLYRARKMLYVALMDFARERGYIDQRSKKR